MAEVSMFTRVLIANRGEIALRILRTCHEMGIETVAAYTKVDEDLLHLKYATDIVCIDQTSYLNGEAMVVAAKNKSCDAIHPGYGFLAENAEFAALVEQESVTFIGPHPDSISSMGDKAEARALANTHGLQPVPGSEGVLLTVSDAQAVAAKIAYPVMLKAAFGGGGRGIRIVRNEGELEGAFREATMEAGTAFAREELYIEKFLDRARHIEVQIAGDGQGKAIYLGSRECSIQRKQQKLIEEAPAANIPQASLDVLCEKSSGMAAALNYRGLGTLEFLYQDDEFYFIEMNTRIQVEHPVTESVTGIDLVKLQIEIAAGNKLTLEQSDITITGHSIECRVNAEDENFKPGPGEVSELMFPQGLGIRVDSHLYNGYEVPHEYDSLVAKIISIAGTRQESIVRMVRALTEFSVNGISHNRDLLLKVCGHPDFLAGNVDTRLLEREII